MLSWMILRSLPLPKDVYKRQVYAYQKEYRLQLAQKLLLETDCTVAEIAHRVGYENPNKFSSAFREAAGMTPTAVSYTHLDVYKRQVCRAAGKCGRAAV